MLALDPKCMLILSANKKNSQNVNNLKCQTVLIQIRPDNLFMLAMYPKCMLILSADKQEVKG